MNNINRREFIYLGLAAGAGLAYGADAKQRVNVHEQLLALAAQQEQQRRDRFAAVRSPADLEKLQKALREEFLKLLDGLPARQGVPPARKIEQIDGDDYVVEKLVLESFPAYFVPALLYRPKKVEGKLPGIISPCGHSHTGKAANSYQILHVNLAKRGYVVLTFDPVGQGERSQYWDEDKAKSRFNLGCGEHCVLGNPLYLLGTSLARYRIHDGLRALDYLEARPEVDGKRLGCVGASGGGTLTSYIAALDPRVQVAVPSCYITTLPRRMGNRIQRDPESDPEQDIYGFVGGGIDHAGLLALRAPRPTQVNAAKLDFFPIEGARESFVEVKKLYEAANAADALTIAEADERHGLSLPLRQAAYAWFDRWLAGRKDGDIRDKEIPFTPRPTKDLEVGQVSVAFKSRHLLPIAVEEFRKRKETPRVPLTDLLKLDPALADFELTEVAPLEKNSQTLVLCVNGIDAPDYREEKELLAALQKSKAAVSVLDPRGVGKLRPPLEVKGRTYGDPLVGVEENIAYNAFLVGKSLLGMRVTDVLAAVGNLKDKAGKIVLLGRRDAALVASLAAAVEPAIKAVAVEEMLLSYWPLLETKGDLVNASYLLPAMLRDYGDIPEVLAAIGPRSVLAAAPIWKPERLPKSVQVVDQSFAKEPKLLTDWLAS